MDWLAEIDAALKLHYGSAPAIPNGQAPDGTQPKLGRGDDASTAVKPPREKGGKTYVQHLVCSGSYLTKTACKACFRCTSEKSMLFRNYRLGFRTYQEMLDLGFKPLEIEGALKNE